MEIPFASFAEFIDMGGYGFNVWSVYFLFIVFLLVNLLGPIQRRKQLLKELNRQAVLSERQSEAQSGRHFEKQSPGADENLEIDRHKPVGETH